MNVDFELTLQAQLDGELPESETRRVAELVARDPQARALQSELQTTTRWLKANEPEQAVPASREFYWSQIERAIERAEREQEPATRPAWFEWVLGWRRWAAPLAGFAAVMLAGVAALRFYDVQLFDRTGRHFAVVENESEHMDSFSFYSHDENMFVVWVYDKNQDSEVATDTERDSDGPILQ